MNKTSLILTFTLLLIYGFAISQDHNIDNLINRGILFYKSRNIDSAMSCFNKAIQLDKQNDEAYFRRALARSKTKDNDGAVADYRMAISINPKPVYYNNIGIILTLEQYHEEALEEFNKALELDSTYLQAIFNKGISYHHMGMPDEACKYTTKARDMGFEAAEQYCRQFCP